MQISKTLYVTTRGEWRAWLKAHYKTAPDIWLIFYKKASGKPRISYNDAVEEALCFGWIDSIVKSIDDEKFAHRFSPRRVKTPYSQTNKERLKTLLKQGKVIASVRESLETLKNEKFTVSPNIARALKTNKEAWKLPKVLRSLQAHQDRIYRGGAQQARRIQKAARLLH